MIGDRILTRLSVLGKSQSWLARQVGITQPAINGLIRGSSRSSAHLHKIARALLTTPEYLTGETEDPDQNAPPAPPPAPHVITMQVVLPPVDALGEMFGGMLDAIPESVSRAELAQQLAQLLPRELSRLKDLRFDSAAIPVPSEASPEFDATPPSADPVHPR